MKKLLPILLLVCHFTYGQNYQCLQNGVKHYFINANGYLRGIRIDSVRITGDTTTYYPFHSPRGSYTSPGYGFPTLDTNGGSWLGKKVIQKGDGTFIFDSYWNDSVIIKTQAHTGDSWTFYSDTSSLYYKATMTAIDTMTVLSTLDSVKKITINAYDGAGPVTSDPLNGFSILLSKNNGFVQTFDLFTFPYHKPDSAYRSGLDFFLDRSTCDYSSITHAPGTAPAADVSLFKLTDFINPNDQQLHNWNIGDTLEGFHKVSAYPSYATYTDYILTHVYDKVISGHAITYSLGGTSYSCTSRAGFCPSSSYYFDPCSLVINAGVRTYYDTIYSMFDSSFMPEENLHFPNYTFYFPTDSSYCSMAPAYILADGSFSPESEAPVYYKLGIGMTANNSFDDDCILFYADALAYTNIHGVTCGALHPLGVNNVNLANDSVKIFPDPASNQLTIESTGSPISEVTIINLTGQVQQCSWQTTNYRQQTINITDLPAEIYLVRVNGTTMKKFVKQ